MIEFGGRLAQDMGLGRISGQIVVYLYLHRDACSLDEMGEELGLSKAAVSTAARQLETLGLLQQVWRRGDRKNYYRTADNLAAVLQKGLLEVIRRKLDSAGLELGDVGRMLDEASARESSDELEFVRGRVQRARVLRDRAARILGSKLVSLLLR